MARPVDEILGELDALQATLDGADAARARRLEVWQEARALAPPITNRVLAEHAGITEVAVIQQLRKARETAAAT